MFAFSRRFLLFVLLLGTWGRAAEVSKEERLNSAAKVRSIFEAKCLDCHSSELARPKGKFGYVLDLTRIAANPDYVVRGKPEESEIYTMVLNDEMPGEDAGVPPLTPEEKEAVKHWVEIGAPGDLPAGHDETAPAAAAAEAKPKGPLWRRALQWVGQFHPLSTHFPVALMMVAVLAEGLAWWSRRDLWFHTVRFLVLISALSGVATTILGWVNAYFSSYDKAAGKLLWWHRWVGTTAGVWALVCAILILISKCEEGAPDRRRFRGALLAGAALIGIAGFLGSALIYGLDHYSFK